MLPFGLKLEVFDKAHVVGGGYRENVLLSRVLLVGSGTAASTLHQGTHHPSSKAATKSFISLQNGTFGSSSRPTPGVSIAVQTWRCPAFKSD
jgi:hypothetical protein